MSFRALLLVFACLISAHARAQEPLLSPPKSGALEAAQKLTTEERAGRTKILREVPPEVSRAEILKLVQELADRKPNTAAALEGLDFRLGALDARYDNDHSQILRDEIARTREAIYEGAARLRLRSGLLRILAGLEKQPVVGWDDLNRFFGNALTQKAAALSEARRLAAGSAGQRAAEERAADFELLEDALRLTMAEWMIGRIPAGPARPASNDSLNPEDTAPTAAAK